MRKLALVAALAAAAVGLLAAMDRPPVEEMVEGQTRCGTKLCIGSTGTPLAIQGTALIGTQSTSTTQYVPSSASGDAGVASAHIEYNQVALSSGTVTVTFAHAFSATPMCVCSDTASSAAACNANSVSKTGATFKGTTSDVVDYICVGDR